MLTSTLDIEDTVGHLIDSNSLLCSVLIWSQFDPRYSWTICLRWTHRKLYWALKLALSVSVPGDILTQKCWVIGKRKNYSWLRWENSAKLGWFEGENGKRLNEIDQSINQLVFYCCEIFEGEKLNRFKREVHWNETVWWFRRSNLRRWFWTNKFSVDLESKVSVDFHCYWRWCWR